MIKKIVFILLGCVIIGFIAAALWWVNLKEKGAEIPKESFIPYNSALVMNVNASFKLPAKLKNMFGEELTKVCGEGIFRIKDSLCLYRLADTAAYTLGVRVEGKSTVRHLMVLDCGNLFSRGKVYSFLMGIEGFGENGEKEYDGHRICVLKGKKEEELYAVLVENMILLSNSSLYIEDALRQLGDKSLERDAKPVCFQNVSRYFSATAGINVYLNTSCFSELLPLYVEMELPKGRGNVSSWFKWGAMDVNAQEEGINFNGFLNYKDMRESFPAVLEGQRPVVMRSDEVLPSASLGVSILALSDVEGYLKALDDFRQRAGLDGHVRKRKQGYVDLYGKEIAESWKKLLSGEWAECLLYYDEREKKADGVVAVRVKAGSLGKELVDKMLGQYVKHVGVSKKSLEKVYRVDDTEEMKYYTFPTSDFVPVMWGEIFGGIANNYVFVKDNYVVFASSTEAVHQFVRDYVRHQSVREQEWYQEIRDKLSREGNWMYLSKVPSMLPFYRSISKGKWQKYLTRNGEKMSSFSSLGWQWANEGDMLYNILFLNTEEVEQQQKQVMWQTRLEAPLAMKPAIVTNHNTGERELFVQDENNTIYLINDIGRILWKLPVDGKINSDVYQVDAYKNGKLQYLFSTSTRIYLIDRNGNYLPRYPLSLSSPCERGITLYDYEGNRDYRIFVPSADRRVCLYDLTGNAVKGWNVPRSDNDIVSQVYHFRVQGKDYIVYAGEHRLYVLDRRGNERVHVSTLLNLAAPTYLYLTRVAGKPCMAMNDAEGNFLLVDFEGRVTTMVPEKVASGGDLNVEDLDGDGVDEFIYACGESVGIYDGKGKLKGEYVWKDARLGFPYTYRFSAQDIRVGLVDVAKRRLFLTCGAGLSKGFPISGNAPFSIAFFDKGTTGFYLFAGNEEKQLLKYRVVR